MLRSALLARGALFVSLAGVAAPSSVSAAESLTVKNKCYVAYAGTEEFPSAAEPIEVSADGIDAGRHVRFTIEVKGQQTAQTALMTASRDGEVMTSVDSWITGMPDGPTKGTDARVVLRDFWLGTELASAPIDVANIGLYVDDVFFDYRSKRRWVVSGLSLLGGGNTYYAHFFSSLEPNAKYLGRLYLGKTTDRCGFMSTKAPLSPIGRKGKYVAKIQASARWNPKLYWAGLRIEIKPQTAPTT